MAGILSGLHATQKDDYPITVMTGHSVSEINLSPTQIEYTAIDSPDYFLVFSEDGLKKTRAWIGELPASCVLMVDEALELPDTNAQVVRLRINEAAKDVGRLSVGIIALAAMLGHCNMYPSEALRTSISRYQSSSVAATNLKAMDRGLELIARMND